jgi:hypothetical protein
MSVHSRLLRIVKLAIVVMPIVLAACKGGTSGY